MSADILDMARHKLKKLDYQQESVPDDKLEQRISAAGALARCVRMMQEDFGDRFTAETLTNELHRVRAVLK